MSAYNTDPRFIDIAVHSLQDQTAGDWQLCIVDNASDSVTLRKYLDDLRDPRIVVDRIDVKREIGEVLNHAFSLSDGEYIGFLDHDDCLEKDALERVYDAIGNHEPDVLYSDEDSISEDNVVLLTQYKSDFSVDMLFSYNYLCHFLVCRRSVFERIGGFRKGFEFAQDYDLVLRLTEHTGRIHHIPRVLYHWRALESSTASNVNNKPEAHDSGVKALTEALERRGIEGAVLPGPTPTIYHVKRRILSNPLVSIIMCFRDKPDLLRNCLSSLLERTTYNNFEFIGIDNGSADPETKDVMAEYSARDERIRFHDGHGEFNFSALTNLGAGLSSGDHVVLLNNDTEVISPDWIEALLEHSQRPEVGAVGGKLYYPDGKIQHAGVTIGIYGITGHSHKKLDGNFHGYFKRCSIIHNVSAVTGACLMVKRSLYDEIGGLNENELKVAYNDIDFCLRLRERGLLNVFTPHCEMVHLESASRGEEHPTEESPRLLGEIRYFLDRHSEILERGDPYYNPNLPLDNESFGITEPPKRIVLSF